MNLERVTWEILSLLIRQSVLSGLPQSLLFIIYFYKNTCVCVRFGSRALRRYKKSSLFFHEGKTVCYWISCEVRFSTLTLPNTSTYIPKTYKHLYVKTSSIFSIKQVYSDWGRGFWQDAPDHKPRHIINMTIVLISVSTGFLSLKSATLCNLTITLVAHKQN